MFPVEGPGKYSVVPPSTLQLSSLEGLALELVLRETLINPTVEQVKVAHLKQNGMVFFSF